MTSLTDLGVAPGGRPCSEPPPGFECPERVRGIREARHDGCMWGQRWPRDASTPPSNSSWPSATRVFPSGIGGMARHDGRRGGTQYRATRRHQLDALARPAATRVYPFTRDDLWLTGARLIERAGGPSIPCHRRRRAIPGASGRHGAPGQRPSSRARGEPVRTNPDRSNPTGASVFALDQRQREAAFRWRATRASNYGWQRDEWRADTSKTPKAGRTLRGFTLVTEARSAARHARIESGRKRCRVTRQGWANSGRQGQPAGFSRKTTGGKPVRSFQVFVARSTPSAFD
jgi:hypothetical protein